MRPKAVLARTSGQESILSLAFELYGGDSLSNVAWHLKARKLPIASDVTVVAGRAAVSTAVIGTVALLAGAGLQKSLSIGAIATAGIDAMLFARLYQQA